MSLLIASGTSKIRSWVLLSLFAVTTPIGLVIGLYSDQFIPNFDFNIILAIVVGMFLHISTTIIFETSENHKFNFLKLLTILGGCALAFFMH
jgi:zinc transporter ZupT